MPAKDFEGNYYANALEEDAIITYLGEYLRRGFDDLPPAVRDLAGELLRHKGTSLTDALAPFHSDESLIATSKSPQSGRRPNPEWCLPLEPFGVLGPEFDQLGEIAQTLYGTGAFASVAEMQYHDLSESVTLYTECAVEVERDGPHAHEVRPLGGDRTFSGALLGPTTDVLDLSVEAADCSPVALSYDPDEEHYTFELEGGRRYRFEWTVPRRAVVAERIDIPAEPVEPGASFDVTVVYRNTSGRSGLYETDVRIGEDQKHVSTDLDAGDVSTETITASFDEPGTYMVQAQRSRCRIDVADDQE
jgi:hypothetical protein